MKIALTPWNVTLVAKTRFDPVMTTVVLVGPLAGQPGVAEPATAAIRRPITLASGPPAITAECLPAAISAVLLLGWGMVAALPQLALVAFGAWFNLAFPR